MTRIQRVKKNEAAVRGGAETARASKRRANRPGTRRKRPGALNLSSSGVSKKGLPLDTMRISDFYRPLKKPVTLRLDADVLAWFKKDGRRYQTRINSALRQMMEREIKQGK